MTRILGVMVLIAGVFIAVGLYRGWFSAEATTTDHKTKINLSVDRDKLNQDVKSVEKSTGLVK